MTWTRYDASMMQKFIVPADVAAPSVANALNTVAVAVKSHTNSWTLVLTGLD